MLKRVVRERFLERQRQCLAAIDVGALFGVTATCVVHGIDFHINETMVAARVKYRLEREACFRQTLVGLVAMIIGIVGIYLHIIGPIAVERVALPVFCRGFPCHCHSLCVVA